MQNIFKKMRTKLFVLGMLASAAPALAQATNTQPPLLITVSVNAAADATIVQGWPVIAQIQVMNPAAFSAAATPTPVTLSGGSGAWSDLIRFRITDAASNAVTMPLKVMTTTDSSINLGTDNVGIVAYAMSAADSGHLQSGVYHVSVEVIGFGTSRASTITVTAEPTTLSPEQTHWKYMLMAGYHALQQHFHPAIAQLDTLLKQQPQDVVAMEFRGDLLGALGQSEDAQAAYEDALAVWMQLNPNPNEPAVSLLRKINSSTY